MNDSRDDDPTLVRNQASLRTSGGKIWLVMGGLLAAISLAVLIPMLWLSATGVATTGLVVVAALYLAMIVTHVTVAAQRRRLMIMAGCMIAMALAALIAVGIVASIEWTATR